MRKVDPAARLAVGAHGYALIRRSFAFCAVARAVATLRASLAGWVAAWHATCFVAQQQSASELWAQKGTKRVLERYSLTYHPKNSEGVFLMPTTKLFLALIALGALAACETVQGAGRDMSNAGRTITAESQAVQNEL